MTKILTGRDKKANQWKLWLSLYIQAYFEDMAAPTSREADEYPRATHTIDGIKRLVHELEHAGQRLPQCGRCLLPSSQFS
jgi:cysteinyl-tRNA synthetase